LTDDAKAKFAEFVRWTTDAINSSTDAGIRELWNRAHLKALKLASLRAVGESYLNPIITLEHTMWATTLIVSQTDNLIAAFTNGKVGKEEGDEVKQINELIAQIAKYLSTPPDNEKLKKLGSNADYHKYGIVTETYLSRNLLQRAAYRGPNGGTRALKRAIQTLLDSSELAEISGKQMAEQVGGNKYGGRCPRAFAINPEQLHRFVDSARRAQS
jgi:hypothetical protein